MQNDAGSPRQNTPSGWSDAPDNLSSIPRSREGFALQRTRGPIDGPTSTTGEAQLAGTADPVGMGAPKTLQISDQAPFRRILLLYDGSPASEEAISLALDMVRCFKAKLLIVGTTPLPDRSNVSELKAIIEDVRARLSRKFFEIRLKSMNEGLWVETMLAVGDPAELAARNAERFRASLIIVGGMRVRVQLEPAICSVFHAVSTRAPCPVLVAR